MNKCFFVLIAVLFSSISVYVQAQSRPTYTVLEAGGIFGLSNSGSQANMHGYQFHFVFGRNFYDKAFLGLGIGNDVYRGRSTQVDGRRSVHRVNTLPLFADFRVPLAPVSALGMLGVKVNAGYAPSIGGDYFKGFLAKAGLTYAHLLAEQSDLLFTVGYGLQQFDSRFAGYQSFHQHNVFITVGLFVH